MNLTTVVKNAIKPKDTISVPVRPVDEYVDAFKELGFTTEIRDDLETNGWQTDFWLNFHKGDEHFTLAGSLWYGRYRIYPQE